MLPAAHRLTKSQDFGLAVRRGRRAGRPLLVVHLLRPTAERDGSPTRARLSPPRVGFVVSKAVGGSVVRHRVSRKLRHLVRDLIPRLPDGTLVVVRALPPSAQASSDALRADLASGLTKLRALDSLPTWDRAEEHPMTDRP